MSLARLLLPYERYKSGQDGRDGNPSHQQLVRKKKLRVENQSGTSGKEPVRQNSEEAIKSENKVHVLWNCSKFALRINWNRISNQMLFTWLHNRQRYWSKAIIIHGWTEESASLCVLPGICLFVFRFNSTNFFFCSINYVECSYLGCTFLWISTFKWHQVLTLPLTQWPWMTQCPSCFADILYLPTVLFIVGFRSKLLSLILYLYTYLETNIFNRVNKKKIFPGVLLYVIACPSLLMCVFLSRIMHF